MKTENIREWLTPTLISAFVFCPRLFFLSIFLPFDGRASPATVLGSLEHDAFGAFDQKTRNEFFKHGVLTADLASAIPERIDSAVDCEVVKLTDAVDKLETLKEFFGVYSLFK